MRNLAQRFRDEEGLTLVELLAAIALSALLLMLVSTVLTTSLMAYGRINDETELRNQAITLSSSLQAKLKNATRIIDGDAVGPLGQFQAEVLTDVLSGSTQPVAVRLDDGNLYVNGSRMNEDGLSLAGSFFVKDGSGLQLHLKFRHINKADVEPLYLFVSIKFIS
ncbi:MULTISPECIES: hypothetical protein [unclassified Paenibacillus]|uniref:hypothetical protein n=1 Tax=unclassified Paenibacillus TaxID=185978 RepID=UPI000839256D|nr:MULTISPECIES: hypothetical protein [unclassified Paenibacillus]NWL86335.1 hypothetical protein [Paenibacillus sp. 79R4]